jgi:hypothetical protein
LPVPRKLSCASTAGAMVTGSAGVAAVAAGAVGGGSTVLFAEAFGVKGAVRVAGLLTGGAAIVPVVPGP